MNLKEWLSLFKLITNFKSEELKNPKVINKRDIYFKSTFIGITKVFFFLRFYLFIHEGHREKGRDIGKGRSRFPVGGPMLASIPVLQDRALSQRQTLNH